MVVSCSKAYNVELIFPFALFVILETIRMFCHVHFVSVIISFYLDLVQPNKSLRLRSKDDMLSYYVFFKNPAYANAALWWFTRVEEQPLIRGLPIRVRNPKNWLTKPDGEPCNTVFVGNLPGDTSVEDVRTTFAPYADIVDIRLREFGLVIPLDFVFLFLALVCNSCFE